MKKVIYLFVLCMVLGLAGCGQSQENKESSTESTSVQVENKNVSDIVSNEHLTNNDTANFQMPEEGYYSNDFDPFHFTLLTLNQKTRVVKPFG